MEFLYAVAKVIEEQHLLDGRYTQIERLYDPLEQHLSMVFKAWDIQQQQHVVLKFISPLLKTNYAQKSFLREGDLLAELQDARCVIPLVENHRNLSIKCTLQGSDLFLNLPYHVTRKAHSSLSDYIASDHKTLAETLRIFLELIEATEELHQHGIYHRDLTPFNCVFMAENQRQLRMIDFAYAYKEGAPRLVEGVEFDQQYARPITNRNYAAVELFCGFGRDPRYFPQADYFSLGLILFEMLTQKKWSSIVYDLNVISDLTQLFYTYVTDGKREEVYAKLIQNLKQSWISPSILDHWSGPLLPEVLALEQVYRQLSDLDYRERATDLTSIKHQLRGLLGQQVSVAPQVHYTTL